MMSSSCGCFYAPPDRIVLLRLRLPYCWCNPFSVVDIPSCFFFVVGFVVYVVVLVSPQGLLTPKDPWMKPLQSTEWTDSLLLELRPVMNISNTIRHEKQEAMSSHFITLSPDASEWA